MWEYAGLHVVDVPTAEALELLLGNDRSPENIRMFVYWMMLYNEKLGESAAIWDDVVFLWAIGLEWLLDDLYKRKVN